MTLKDEILRARARLKEAEDRAYALEVECDALIKDLRSVLDPYEHLLDMDLEKAKMLLDKLQDNQLEYRRLKETIKRLQREVS